MVGRTDAMTRRPIAGFVLVSLVVLVGLAGTTGCEGRNDSDSRQEDLQERLLAEGTAQTGMPGIKNFRERKIMKDILELRDQANLVTFTYLVAAQTADLRFFCDSIGYGFPAATQYTNPSKWSHYNNIPYVMPQADPNGLFSPSSAEGTWVMCRDPGGTDVKPVYVEERIVVTPFRMTRGDASAPAEKTQK